VNLFADIAEMTKEVHVITELGPAFASWAGDRRRNALRVDHGHDKAEGYPVAVVDAGALGDVVEVQVAVRRTGDVGGEVACPPVVAGFSYPSFIQPSSALSDVPSTTALQLPESVRWMCRIFPNVSPL
jgi:hypothetical protein